MTAYAIAQLQNVNICAEIVEYIERIDATLEPFDGRFLVHGGNKNVIEGAWPGDIVMIEFPDERTALAWYNSDAYQEIIALRTNNSTCDVAIAAGVPDNHKSMDILEALWDGGAPGRIA
ncbi:MAG: DUF1330 domain-containing protein [Rhodospirillales bacterium]|nr:DUF1330 domain-containing protein [Rhodospirillales bacterium]MBO6785839.1 DUF1330 domain-containing protein [Rhodospirillales bacterium]